jgi:hypothetical protein
MLRGAFKSQLPSSRIIAFLNSKTISLLSLDRQSYPILINQFSLRDAENSQELIGKFDISVATVKSSMR